MIKKKSIDYILGMLTGASIMISAWACTSGAPLNATGSTIQEGKIVNQKWEPVYTEIVD